MGCQYLRDPGEKMNGMSVFWAPWRTMKDDISMEGTIRRRRRAVVVYLSVLSTVNMHPGRGLEKQSGRYACTHCGTGRGYVSVSTL